MTLSGKIEDKHMVHHLCMLFVVLCGIYMDLTTHLRELDMLYLNATERFKDKTDQIY